MSYIAANLTSCEQAVNFCVDSGSIGRINPTADFSAVVKQDERWDSCHLILVGANALIAHYPLHGGLLLKLLKAGCIFQSLTEWTLRFIKE